MQVHWGQHLRQGQELSIVSVKYVYDDMSVWLQVQFEHPVQTDIFVE